LSIADKIANKIQSIRDYDSNFSPITYLSNAFKKPFPQIKFNYVSRHEIEKMIKSLKSSNSYTYDEISVKILKESSPFISSPLTKIFNQSLSTGNYPEYLKYSNI
jgi:hypothetical protein